MAHRRQAGGRRLARRVADLELQRRPVGRGVAGEVDGRALVGPGAGRQALLAAVPAGLQRPVRPGEPEAAAHRLVRVGRVLLVDPRVRGHARQRRVRPVAAPVQPPEVRALLLHRLVQVEVRLELVGVAPVEDVVVTVLRQPALRGGLRPWELRV